ncbi:hypothetical protein [Paenibacillus humicola]|uniref:hypothetical protein n=1 Tax=Paenibacillus humicola TaxID=3110540 RepID=UPI00237BD1AB|nr:hypothetical protein [Paenibacillus humicola]
MSRKMFRLACAAGLSLSLAAGSGCAQKADDNGVTTKSVKRSVPAPKQKAFVPDNSTGYGRSNSLSYDLRGTPVNPDTGKPAKGKEYVRDAKGSMKSNVKK